ncbi:hypothetical protein [Ralstonia phage RP13]|nr:hypothetical protein [Ralstonia phage RP13]
MLYIDNLDRYKDYLVTIVCGNKESGITDIQGILTDEHFNLPTRAEFANSDTSMLVDAVKGAAGAVAGKAGGVAKSLVDKKFNTLIQSARDWQSGSGIDFSVNFTVFKSSKSGVSNTPSFKDFNANLVKLTQSKTTDVNLPQQSHYDSFVDRLTDIQQITAKEANLFTVNIGNWFQCSKLIPTSATMQLSTYVDTSGSPIFAQVTIAFESYRNLSSSEWAEILRK